LIGEICSGSGLSGSERVGGLTVCSERKIKKKLQEHEKITRFLIEDLLKRILWIQEFFKSRKCFYIFFCERGK